MKASGQLPAPLANLDKLQFLRLNGNWFNGTLPPQYAFGFPSLVEIRLDYNSLTVCVGTVKYFLLLNIFAKAIE